MMTKRRRTLKRPVLLITVLLLILALGITVLFTLNRFPKELLAVQSEDKNFGITERVKEKNKHMFKVYHFPKTKISSVNSWIKEEMNQNDDIVQDHLDTDEKIQVKQDYSSDASNNIASVKLRLYINQELVREVSQSFDLENNQPISADHLFIEAGNTLITQKLRSHFTQGTLDRHDFLDQIKIENIKNFYINKDDITFYKDDESLTLALKDTTHYLKQELYDYQPTDGFVPSVYIERGVDPNEKLLAFTFDDGPHWEITEKLMDTLEEYDGQGTFFIVGSRVEESEVHNDILKSILDRGHQLANHSYNHQNFNTLGSEALNDQIDRTNNIFEEATGYKGPYMVRPPYGNANSFVRENTNSVYVNWNLDTLDWLTRDAQMICNEIKQSSEDGDIILMHDLYEASYEGFQCGIKELAKEGYQFVTVEELFKARGVEYEPGNIYYNAPERD